jgi:hypothetical protein
MTPIELTKTEFIQRVGNFEESRQTLYRRLSCSLVWLLQTSGADTQ